jgi:hypothetical protein
LLGTEKKNENDFANVVTEEVHDALLLSVDSPIESWVLDSGASFHTIAHREIIQNYVASDFGKVYLADDEALDVVGMGDVRITLPNGSVWLLQKVRHVLELKRNLISVGQLDIEGHAILFVGGTWKITKGAMVVARGKKTGTLYMTTSPRDTIAVAEAGTDTNLWHRRLGHMSEKGMKVLLSKGKLPKLKFVEFDMCESCILGKQKKVSFLKGGRTPKSKKLKLSQTEYVKKILSRFSMDEAKSVSTPLGSHFRLTKDQSPKTEQEQAYMSKVPYASAIGSLMYAMVCTRPNIAHAMGVVSRYMSNPGKQHWEAVKWILRYLKGTLGTSLCFTGADMKLTGYVDSDLAGDVDTRKSTTGYVYTLGGTAVSWVSRLQKIVALFTTEVEYVAVTEAGKEMVWL